MRIFFSVGLLCSFLSISSHQIFSADEALSAEKPTAQKTPRILVGTLGFPTEQLLSFAERVKPDFVVMGAFGAPQWMVQESPRAWVAKWKAIFNRMHKSHVKVVGMIELLNAGNSPAEAEKFIDFFENRWDEKLLGKKPAVSGASLLEKRNTPEENQEGAQAPRGCANNKNWRSVEKSLVKAMIDAGIDGFITHRNMFGECGCPFCHADWETAEHAIEHSHKHHQKGSGEIMNVACDHCSGGLRRWLADNYELDELKQRFEIKDIKTHQFKPINGLHLDHESLPNSIELEALKFTRHVVKEAFDDIFVDYARSVKPDLIVAQWNHMPYFDELHLDMGHIPRWHMTTFAHASVEERWSLPIELWGKGESFYWYCNWGTCQNTQLDKRFLADVTLYAKLLRSMARGKPYLINKYDFFRPRNMMAEAAALGMVAGAIQVPHGTDEDADVMARYFNFLRKYDDLYLENNGTAVSDILVIYPRLVTHDGDADGLEMIEIAGRSLVTAHRQFDMIPDDLLPTTDLSKYKVVVVAEAKHLDHEIIDEYVQAGGKIIALPRTAKKANDIQWDKWSATIVKGLKPHTGGTEEAAGVLAAVNNAIGERSFSCDAPYTLEPHVYRQQGRYVVHFVNYNHTEKSPGKSYVEREAPIKANPVKFRMPLKTGEAVKRVTFLDPDSDESQQLKFTQTNQLFSTKTPEFLVYGICIIELE